MAKWQMTLNGNPATNGDGQTLPIFDDGCGEVLPSDPQFKTAEGIATKHLASIPEYADGMILVCDQDNSFSRASGTHTYNA